MFARLAVLVCLLNTGAFPHTSGSAPASRGMFVLVRNQTRNPPAAMYAMRQEAAALMQTAGYRVHWLDEPREVTAAFLVIVTLDERGAAQPQSPRTVLASAAVAEGRILPFVTINCAAVREFLPTALRSNLPPPFVYGRALGRLMAHELYHIAGRTGEHTAVGITQSAVSVDDLICGHLTFGLDALVTLRHAPENRVEAGGQ